MRIAIALPYAVSIRDFVSSGALQELLVQTEADIEIHTLNTALPELSAYPRVSVLKLEPYIDSTLEKMVKALYPMFFFDRFAYVRIAHHGKPLRSAIGHTCVALRKAIGVRLLLRGLSALLLLLYRLRAKKRTLSAHTTLLIGTRSLINSLDYGLIADASVQTIPILTIASSWDNFTTKGYFPFPALRTIVWNEKMRQELMDLFGVPACKIDVSGYPRASLLRTLVTGQTAEQYLREIGISGYKRFILYSASYAELTRIKPDKPPLEYVAIRSVCYELMDELPDDVCILIRLHPFSGASDREYFATLPRCFVFVPGRNDVYVERVMNREDERHLAIQIAKSTCVVSMASTISIDSLCLHHPIINIAFEPVADVAYHVGIKRFYEFDHFKNLVRISKIPLARDLKAVSEFVHTCLNGKYESPADYAQFERMYVPAESNRYPQIVASVVSGLLSGKTVCPEISPVVTAQETGVE